jgi:5-methylcytosine-specific restriction protein A
MARVEPPGPGEAMFRVCGQRGCPTTYEGNESRCPEHRKAAQKRHWEDTKAYKSAGHRNRFRPGVLDHDPICVLCHIAAATIADHWPKSRKELIALGLDPDDPRYGRGLCKPCHDTETAQNQPGGWNKK